jgi:hypothetical protein
MNLDENKSTTSISVGQRISGITERADARTALTPQGKRLGLPPVAREHEAGPVERGEPSCRAFSFGLIDTSQTAPGFQTSPEVLTQHLKLRFTERADLGHLLLPKVRIESLHQFRCGVVRNLPQTGNSRFSAGQLKGPLQAERALTSSHLS